MQSAYASACGELHKAMAQMQHSLRSLTKEEVHVALENGGYDDKYTRIEFSCITQRDDSKSKAKYNLWWTENGPNGPYEMRGWCYVWLDFTADMEPRLMADY